MLDAFEKRLRMEIRSKHYSMVNADTACHQLYGFKVALEQLGLLDESKCFVYPDHFKVRMKSWLACAVVKLPLAMI